ncbi:ATP-binding protein [Sandaracinobacter sp. RS1-74]|uniref:AAA family ATPase n=1 Tax=Sandaracinobacteroides sayramensis TaxID=2913411 RepID=UPI001EDB4E3A|nr:AAA family ATPase [Sandaracinobacteroides sayramensis]MCG2839925.1 ATP-binding protein [Sandaracinobacteroides sayramensis]
MQLEKVHVTNFRSVDDSQEFTIDPVTCLVGKNEAGKSAILLALAALNPHPTTPAVFDKERDYPRRLLTQYEERHGNKEALAISTKWRLQARDMAKIEATIGKGVIKNDLVSIERRYGIEIEVNAQLNFAAGLANLYDRFALDESERAVLAQVTNTSELISTLAKLSSPTARHQELKAHMAANGTITSQVGSLIKSMLPKFMYFSSYDRMDGAIQLEQTRQLIANGQINTEMNRGARLFSEFLDYAGVSIDEITNVTTYETFNARLQAASNNITDQVLEYWTQNPDLSVAVRVEQARSGDPAPLNSGTIAWARINNHLHRVDTPFSERSAGFVWFFSFLVKFAQVKDEETPVVLLLDEPGLTLHGKAQADLLRFFKDKLAPHHQIIYSTHSPFMVPADELASVRIVEDQVEMKGVRRMPLGTKVRSDVLTRDPDTLFPLQGALGYEITQSLFVGKHTMLLEGPGDILYIQALSDALKRRGRTGLDTRWTLCPAGGIDKIRPFVAMFSGNALHIAVLSDQAKGDNRKVDDLKRAEILKAGHFYTMADFMGRPEADIEDIFEPELFAAILNGTYGFDDTRKLTAASLKKAGNGTDRLVKQAEAAFAVMSTDAPLFDHFTPAAWLIRNPKVLDLKTGPVPKTLDRAQTIFDTYNELL